jgi:hypothetical protein
LVAQPVQLVRLLQSGARRRRQIGRTVRDEKKGEISARSPAGFRTLAPPALRTAHSHARTYTGKACLACDGARAHTAAASARACVRCTSRRAWRCGRRYVKPQPAQGPNRFSTAGRPTQIQASTHPQAQARPPTRALMAHARV